MMEKTRIEIGVDQKLISDSEQHYSVSILRNCMFCITNVALNVHHIFTK